MGKKESEIFYYRQTRRSAAWVRSVALLTVPSAATTTFFLYVDKVQAVYKMKNSVTSGAHL